MKLLFENWRKFLEDGINPTTEEHDGKYYAFDWDDNIVRMPTKIILMSEAGEEVGMSTADFAEHREKIGMEKIIDDRGNIIVGFAEGAFRNFRETGDVQFLEDIKSAEPAKSWPDLVECINSGSIFAIITARGHKPETLRTAVRYYIENNVDNINKDMLATSLRKYMELETEEGDDKRNMMDEQLINRYLEKLCKFYPVSNKDLGGESDAVSPQGLKVKYLGDFKKHVENVHSKLPGPDRPQIGFSDDDPRNIESIKQSFSDVENLTVKYTGPPAEEEEIT